MFKLNFDTDLLFSYIQENPLPMSGMVPVYSVTRKDEYTIVKASKDDLVKLASEIHEWGGGWDSFSEVDVIECMEAV